MAIFELDQQLTPFEDEHFAAQQQIDAERIDEALIAHLVENNPDLVAMNRAVLDNLQAALRDADEDSSSAGEFDVVPAAPANELAQEGAANVAGGDQFPADEQAQDGAANAAANEEMVSDISQEVDGAPAAEIVISSDEE